MEIIRYTNEYKLKWDHFIDSSKNGTFLLKRDFMEYHSERFEDCSFLFIEKNKVQCVIPGNIDFQKNTFYSHQGLTYGGLILSCDITATKVLLYVEMMLNELKKDNIHHIIYKGIPSIYHKYPAEEDLYALFRYNAQIIERKISSTIKLSSPLPFRQSRKEGVHKAIKNKLEITESSDFSLFWRILNEVLLDRHHSVPVHTLKEINLLKDKFPDKIRLFEVRKQNEVIAGCLMFDATYTTTHVQYIAASKEGKSCGALDFLFDQLIHEYYKDFNYFDFGVSVEQGGSILNEGLIFQKEGFGGRGIVYDTYLIKNI